MKKLLIIMSLLLWYSSYSQVKTFSAINVIDSLSVGGSPFIDTVIDISTYNGNLQVDTITANMLVLPNDTIIGENDTISINDITSFMAAPQIWTKSGLNIYPTDISRWVGIGTTTPRAKFEVADHIVFNNNYSETSIGYHAGVPNGYRNTFIGSDSGKNIDYADNVAVGSYTLYQGVHIRDNTAVGSSAGMNNTGNANTLIGYKSGYNNTGNNLIAIGYQAGYNNTSDRTIAIGYNAGYSNAMGNGINIGWEAGKNLTTQGIYIGHYSGSVGTGFWGNIGIGNFSLRNITAGKNVAIGEYSLYKAVDANYNTVIGDHAGYNNVTGDSCVLIGYNAGYYNLESNKLYIENSNSTSPLIYGEFDNDYLKFNADSIDYINAVAQYHRLDSLSITTADTWQDIKLDTNIAGESTYGFSFNADSTGIIIGTQGVFRVQGCVHWHYNGSALTKVKLYLRVLIDGVEARCLQSNAFKDRRADDYGTQPFTGTVYANYGDLIQLQVRVSDTDMVLKGDTVYDNPVAASINFEKITFK